VAAGVLVDVLSPMVERFPELGWRGGIERALEELGTSRQAGGSDGLGPAARGASGANARCRSGTDQRNSGNAQRCFGDGANRNRRGIRRDGRAPRHQFRGETLDPEGESAGRFTVPWCSARSSQYMPMGDVLRVANG
jgi:hypothetical protein